MLIIEYSKRKSYYKALEKTEERFVNYVVRRYLSVHKKRLQRGSLNGNGAGCGIALH